MTKIMRSSRVVLPGFCRAASPRLAPLTSGADDRPSFLLPEGRRKQKQQQAMGGGSRPPTAAGVGASTLSMASENFGHSAARLRRVKKLQFGVTNPHELVRFPLVVRVRRGTISTRGDSL